MSKERMCVALLLDRSGSMQSHKIETISAINSYIHTFESVLSAILEEGGNREL